MPLPCTFQMCYLSFLADPFHYTLLLSTLYALISHVGYSRSAESIYSTFMATFGRGEYKKFMGKWKELKAAKSEVTKVSAQVLTTFLKNNSNSYLIIIYYRMNLLNGLNYNVKLINFKLTSILSVRE